MHPDRPARGEEMKDAGKAARMMGKPRSERKARRGNLVVPICFFVLMTTSSIDLLTVRKEAMSWPSPFLPSSSAPKNTSALPLNRTIERGYVVILPDNETHGATSDTIRPKRRTNRSTTTGGARGRAARCSCLNSRANGTCCQRAVLRAHKFGHLLTQKLFKPLESKTGILRMPIGPGAFPSDPSHDYRHVVMTRNFFETFVSGYLYHKSGRECWLTFNGWRRPRSWGERNSEWRHFVKMSGFDIGSYPPRNDRSICRYLADESEEDGMKVYIAAALSWFYSGLDPYLRRVRERQLRGEPQRTLLVCLEDASDAESEEAMFYRMMDWLYPRGHKRRYPKDAASESASHGGHATSRNRKVRLRLLRLVKRYDRELFNNSLAKTDEYFGCNGTIR